MEPFLNGQDHASVRMAARETVTIFGESLVIHRFVSFTGGSDAGVNPHRNTRDISTRGRVFNLSEAEVLNSGGIASMGAIKTHTIVKIIGSGRTTDTQPDKMTYEGQIYLVTGKPKRKKAGGGRFLTEAMWNMVKS